MRIDLLELLGPRYLIDHCLIQFERETKDEAYRRYIAEVLRLTGENVAALTHGSYIASKWGDMRKQAPEDNRTGDEIAADIIKRAGLRAAGEGDA